jgi:hypothetical protein
MEEEKAKTTAPTEVTENMNVLLDERKRMGTKWAEECAKVRAR